MGQLLRPKRLVFDLTSLCHSLQDWQNLIDCGLLFLKLPLLWQCSELASQPRGRPFTQLPVKSRTFTCQSRQQLQPSSFMR